MDFLSTGAVAELLTVETHRLGYLTRDRQIRPFKGPTGAFLWSYEEVCRAAELSGIGIPTAQEFREKVRQTCGQGQAAGMGFES